MYDVLRNLISAGTQTLRDLESRIAWNVNKGYITPDEADELTVLANSQSAPPDVPENTEMAVRLGTVEATVTLLAARVEALEGKTGETGGGDETPAGPPPGVEVWKAGTAYMYGAKVWYDGHVWVSQEGNNRNVPGTAAWAWKQVV